MLSEKKIKKIIDTFSAEGKLFSNERQFQLELAWALKKEGYDVSLEVLEDKTEKTYIDLVVKERENEYIAIELKYTTRQTDKKRMDYHIGDKVVPVYSQGAGDVRQYAYLKDVQRIESLKTKDNVFGWKNARVVRGYAIIMTNDNYSEKKGIGKAYEDVALYKGRNIPRQKDLVLKIKGFENKEPVRIEGDYRCKWEPYRLGSSKIIYETQKKGKVEVGYDKYPFEYMITEI